MTFKISWHCSIRFLFFVKHFELLKELQLQISFPFPSFALNCSLRLCPFQDGPSSLRLPFRTSSFLHSNSWSASTWLPPAHATLYLITCDSTPTPLPVWSKSLITMKLTHIYPRPFLHLWSRFFKFYHFPSTTFSFWNAVHSVWFAHGRSTSPAHLFSLQLQSVF